MIFDNLKLRGIRVASAQLSDALRAAEGFLDQYTTSSEG